MNLWTNALMNGRPGAFVCEYTDQVGDGAVEAAFHEMERSMKKAAFSVRLALGFLLTLSLGVGFGYMLALIPDDSVRHGSVVATRRHGAGFAGVELKSDRIPGQTVRVADNDDDEIVVMVDDWSRPGGHHYSLWLKPGHVTMFVTTEIDSPGGIVWVDADGNSIPDSVRQRGADGRLPAQQYTLREALEKYGLDR